MNLRLPKRESKLIEEVVLKIEDLIPELKMINQDEGGIFDSTGKYEIEINFKKKVGVLRKRVSNG